MAKRGRAVHVRSRQSGKDGICYPDDLYVWIEGPGVAGWYRPDTLKRDFIVEDIETKDEQK